MYIDDMKIYRRIISIFLIITTASGVLDELTEYGNLTDDAVGGVIITIIIVYFLLRNPKKKLKKTKIRNKDSEIVQDIVDLEIETTEVRSENDKSNTFSRKSKNIISPSTSSYSPINDKESLITRMFKGKSDRIG